MHPQPRQLEMFPTAVRLVPVRARAQREPLLSHDRHALLGDWTLIREWGRRGSSGQMRRDPHRTAGEAIGALLTLQRKKLRRGYEPCWV